MLIQFLKTDGMKSYHDLPHSWVDRDQREVEDEWGAKLIEDFPNNFAKVGGVAVPKVKKTKKK